MNGLQISQIAAVRWIFALAAAACVTFGHWSVVLQAPGNAGQPSDLLFLALLAADLLPTGIYAFGVRQLRQVYLCGGFLVLNGLGWLYVAAISDPLEGIAYPFLGFFIALALTLRAWMNEPAQIA
jgi:hypothetical protein